jgi:sulfopyruvate decarboxylase TPP-binding subunit
VQQASDAWVDAIHRAFLELSVRQVAYVPDAGHARLIRLCQSDPSMVHIPLTTEEEGIALLTGAWLGGDRGVLLMQSSGVGNCVNMLTLPRTCRIPLLALVTCEANGASSIPGSSPWARAPRTSSRRPA